MNTATDLTIMNRRKALKLCAGIVASAAGAAVAQAEPKVSRIQALTRSAPPG